MLTVKKSDAIRRFQKQKLLKIIWIIFLFFWGDRTTSTQDCVLTNKTATTINRIVRI